MERHVQVQHQPKSSAGFCRVARRNGENKRGCLLILVPVLENHGTTEMELVNRLLGTRSRKSTPPR